MGAISTTRRALASRTRALASMRASAMPRALGTSALVLGGAAVGGAADKAIGQVGGVDVSTLAGVAGGVAGYFMKSPKAVVFSAGMLAHMARQAGEDVAASFTDAA